jgi:hypothetical protein
MRHSMRHSSALDALHARPLRTKESAMPTTPDPSSVRRRLARALVASTLALTAVGATGCFGKFALTRKLYAWNDHLGDKWVESLAFWGLCIIPVYELVATGDFVVLNVVEFWKGTNPVADARDVRMFEKENGAVEVVYRGDTFRLEPATASHFRVARNGVPLGEATIRPDGSLALETARGTLELHPGDGARPVVEPAAL